MPVRLETNRRNVEHDLRVLWVRDILLAMFVVACIDYKLAIYDYKSNGPIWFASILWQDALIALFLFWLSSLPVTMLVSLSTTALAVLEIISHRGEKKIDIPWKLTYKLLQEWEAYSELVAIELTSTNGGSADQPGGFYNMAAVLQRQLTVATLLAVLLHHLDGQLSSPPRPNRFLLPTSKSNVGLTASPPARRRNRFIVWVGAIGCFYILAMFLYRPSNESYSVQSRTILHQVGQEIYLGYREEKELQDFYIGGRSNHKNVGVLPSLLLSTGQKPNVIVILLESTRKDMMPFDYSSPWAKKHLMKNAPPVTPFYDEWTKDKDTVSIPTVQTVASYTHKSVFSTFCSQHGLPRTGTQEHAKPAINQCLPSIMQDYGYVTKLFKGMTRNFDHQSALAASIGFQSIYGLEDFLGEQKENADAFLKQYGGGRWKALEDKPYLRPILEWVDEQQSEQQPFLMTYMTSVTHAPPVLPKNNWTEQRFAEHGKINQFLNTISYEDDFVSLLVEGLNKRGLLNNTLLLMMGDHGCDLGDYGQTGNAYRIGQQVAFEVGLTIHSEHKELRRRLNLVRPNVQGNWSTLDIAPTILDLLGIPISTPDFRGRAGQEDSANMASYLVDGKSMLRGPSGSRTHLSIINTGQGLLLKDGDMVVVNVIGDSWWFYDLHADPMQLSPMQMPTWPVQKIDGKVTMNDEAIAKYGDWATQAKYTVEEARKELEAQFATGVRNSTGVIQKLLTLETLGNKTHS